VPTGEVSDDGWCEVQAGELNVGRQQRRGKYREEAPLAEIRVRRCWRRGVRADGELVREKGMRGGGNGRGRWEEVENWCRRRWHCAREEATVNRWVGLWRRLNVWRLRI